MILLVKMDEVEIETLTAKVRQICFNNPHIKALSQEDQLNFAKTIDDFNKAALEVGCDINQPINVNLFNFVAKNGHIKNNFITNYWFTLLTEHYNQIVHENHNVSQSTEQQVSELEAEAA